MTTQHTPGPWYIDRILNNANLGYRAIIDGDGYTVCSPSPMGQANARLIAASPDLLAALQAVWEFFEPVYVSAMAEDTERTAQDELMDTVRAAIAQATGEA